MGLDECQIAFISQGRRCISISLLFKLSERLFELRCLLFQLRVDVLLLVLIPKSRRLNSLMLSLPPCRTLTISIRACRWYNQRPPRFVDRRGSKLITHLATKVEVMVGRGLIHVEVGGFLAHRVALIEVRLATLGRDQFPRWITRNHIHVAGIFHALFEEGFSARGCSQVMTAIFNFVHLFVEVGEVEAELFRRGLIRMTTLLH